MKYRSLGMLWQLFLFLSGFLLSGSFSLSIARDCCADVISSLNNTTSYGPEPILEQKLLSLTNQHRISKGLQALALDDSLTQIAREHSQGMAHQGFISHSRPMGDLRVRMTRAGYLLEVARENVARAPTIEKAQNALVASPGHEANILANDVTRVGIGIARCPFSSSRQLYITEIFASPREKHLPTAVQRMLVSRVDQLRQNGAGSILLDSSLEKMASRSLESINLPYKREDLQDLLAASTKELQNEKKMGLSRVEANVQLVHNPKNLNIPQNVREGQASSYGVAIRQVTDSKNQVAFLVLTLIGVSR